MNEFKPWFKKQFGALPGTVDQRLGREQKIYELEKKLFILNRELGKDRRLQAEFTSALYAYNFAKGIKK